MRFRSRPDSGGCSRQTSKAATSIWGLFLGLVLPLIPIILLLVVAGVLSDLILRDWMLPHIALDNATAGEAWRQVRARIMAEKRQFIVYAMLRVILPTIASIAVIIVLAIPGLLMAGTIAAMEWGIHSAFSGSTGSSWLVGVVLEVFFGLVAFGFALLASICIGGPLSTGVREYALIFYGGRYKALGDILYPSPGNRRRHEAMLPEAPAKNSIGNISASFSVEQEGLRSRQRLARERVP